MGLRDSLNCIWDSASKREAGLLILSLVLLLVAVTLDVTDQHFYEANRGWVVVIFSILFLFATVPPTIRCASQGYTRVWLVCGASAVILTVFTVCFFLAYFSFVKSEQASLAVDKILNIPPVLAAMWAAGMGWYVHFQASSKNNRTTNSFNLLMQTRTSAEFLKMVAAAQRVYPYGVNIPTADKYLFPAASQAAALAAYEAAAQAGGPIPANVVADKQKAEAIYAVKYLLNYYEFMAVGLKAKDLDENLLYDTIAVNVTSVFDRAEVYIREVRDPNGGKQPLAFDALEDLVMGWQKRLKDEIHQKG